MKRVREILSAILLVSVLTFFGSGSVAETQVVPDLVVTATDDLASAVTGQQVDVSWTVKSQGTGDARPSWNDSLYLSTNDVWDVSGTEVTSPSRSFAVVVGSPHTLRAAPIPIGPAGSNGMSDLYVAISQWGFPDSTVYVDRIDRVTPSGERSTFYAYGPQAEMIRELAFDAAGNLYVSILQNGPVFVNRIDRVTPSGERSTFYTPDYLAFIQGNGLVFDNRVSGEIAALVPVEYRWGAPSPGYSRANWPIFEAWMNVRLENKGLGDAFNVKATVTSWPSNVTIVDGEVSFGDIPAGSSAWSSDTFRLKVDTSKAVDPSIGILWKIEYDDAFGGHHAIENAPQILPAAGP